MKTSFANTFHDYAQGKNSLDHIRPHKTATREIKDENGNNIPKDQIFVIVSINESFKSSRTSTLLVNKEIKKKYDQIYDNIREKEEVLVKKLKSFSGLKEEVKETLADAITHEKKDWFQSLVQLYPRVIEERESHFSDISYKAIFNDGVLDLLSSPDVQNKLEQYISIYDQLLNRSAFFKKGVFNHTNAAEVGANTYLPLIRNLGVKPLP